MPKLKIKKGDTVVVISGRDKGKSGEVLRVYPAEARAIVQGVHVARRHTKPRMGDPGGIVEKELTIHVSNLAHRDPQSGQRPVVIRARRSIATFKLRQNMPIGVKVTLRRERMYEFLDRLITVALPRVRDFRGVSARSFDGRGNYALGLREQLVFPEIDYDRIDTVRGMDIVIVTTAKTDDEARALLKGFEMPFTGTT